MAQRFSRPAATGGNAFARYNYEWSQVGVRINTKRVAIGALKALYGAEAARRAIRLAQRISRKRR
jgi:hypothetical protein